MTEAFPVRVLELRSVRGTGGGPEKTILLGAARSDPARFAVTVCYIRDLRDAVFKMDRRAAELGVDYVEITERHSFDPGIWRQLKDVVRARRIDLVHAHDYKTDLLTWMLARRTPIVPLSTAHGWAGDSPRERLYYATDKWLLARFPAVIAVSGPIRSTLIAHGAAPERVFRVSNGVDHQVFRHVPGARSRVRQELGLTEQDVVLGSVGRLEAEKRFELLIGAAARLPERPHVVIVGEGSLRGQLMERAASLGMADRLSLPGLRSDVADLLHAFDVYVQTSEREGIPNVVLEAMATEIPVVATNVGGTSELIDDGVHGLLVASEDADAIAGAVSRTLHDADETRGRVRAARARVEHELSFAERMARVEAIYLEVLARYRSPRRAASRQEPPSAVRTQVPHDRVEARTRANDHSQADDAPLEPSVSFVIPVRNDALRLGRCLESINANAYPKFDVVVVDNGSSDGSSEVALRLGARVLHQPTGRVAKLRNAGVAASSGGVVAFVDADHWISPEWIREAVRSLGDARVGAVGALCHPPQDGTWVQKTYDLLRQHPTTVTEVQWLGAGNLAIVRGVFTELGGFDETLEASEDVELCQRIRRAGYRILSNEKLRNIHYGDPAGLRELFRSELWRGRDNLQVSLRFVSSVRDLPSVLIPIFNLVLLAVAAVALITVNRTGVILAGGALGGVLVLSGLRAIRMIARLPQRSALGIIRALTVALVYDFARAFALVVRKSHRRATAASPTTTDLPERSP